MFLNFGTGVLGRFISGLIEVLIVILVYILLELVLNELLGFAIPEAVETIGSLILALYLIGRTFGFIGPANV